MTGKLVVLEEGARVTPVHTDDLSPADFYVEERSDPIPLRPDPSRRSVL